MMNLNFGMRPRNRRKFSLCTTDEARQSSSDVEIEPEKPIWGAVRQKICSFVQSRSGSPGRSPGCRSLKGLISPKSISPSGKIVHRQHVQYNPNNSAPASRCQSVSGTPPRSPPATYSPPLARHRRSSYSKSRRESYSTSGDTEFSFSQRKTSRYTNSGQRKSILALDLGKQNSDSLDSSIETPKTGSPITPGFNKNRTKSRGSIACLDFQRMDDDLRMIEGLVRPRKWSYHGTASPAADVDSGPKRHSFSTSSDHKSGIVVSNNDLAKLLGQNTLLLPGLPSDTITPLPNLANPKARGRSQSIAVCAKAMSGKPPSNEPVAPVTIKTIDCDHLAALHATACARQKQEKLLWDSAGSTVNVNLLGSVIEKYLKSPDEPRKQNNIAEEPEDTISQLQEETRDQTIKVSKPETTFLVDLPKKRSPNQPETGFLNPPKTGFVSEQKKESSNQPETGFLRPKTLFSAGIGPIKESLKQAKIASFPEPKRYLSTSNTESKNPKPLNSLQATGKPEQETVTGLNQSLTGLQVQ